MNSRTLGPGAALLVAVLSFVLAGCETPRERALARGRPAELALIPSEVLPKIALAGDERAAMRPFRYSDHQSVHILQVAPSAKLRKRYHTRQDLTLICIQGSAVVEVEGQRHFIARGSAVSIPLRRQS